MRSAQQEMMKKKKLCCRYDTFLRTAEIISFLWQK
jgi:hypothetical protein